MKKLLSLVLVVAMLLSVSLVAFADGESTLRVLNATYDKTYTWYQIFTATVSGEGDSICAIYHATDAQKAIIDAMNDSTDPAFDPDCPFAVTTNGSDHIVTVKEGVVLDAISAWFQAKSKTDTAKENYKVLQVSEGTMTYADGMATASVPAGYYFVTTTMGSVVTMNPVLAASVDVYDKNEGTPEGPDKKITKENEETFDPGKAENDAQVGSVEEFTVTFEAVNFVTKVSSGTTTAEKILNWHIVDTPTNLNIIVDDAHPFKVFVNGTEIASTAYTKTLDSGVLTVDIPWVNTTTGDHLYSPAAKDDTHDGIHIPVKIVYYAEVLPGAAYAPAPNAVTVTYGHVRAGTPVSDIPTDPTDPEYPTPDEPIDPDDPDPKTTVTYTYGFDLVKVDGNNNPLTGATFKLELVSGDPATYTAIRFIESVVGDHYEYRVATPEEIADGTVTKVTEFVMTDHNKAFIRGLDKAKYRLTETNAPADYNPADPIIIEVGAGLTKIEGSSTDPEDVTVVNHKGTVLPTTGGIGTTLFYVIGAILFFGAAAILIARRKVSER